MELELRRSAKTIAHGGTAHALLCDSEILFAFHWVQVLKIEMHMFACSGLGAFEDLFIRQGR